jgi:hypothetical protein
LPISDIKIVGTAAPIKVETINNSTALEELKENRENPKL